MQTISVIGLGYVGLPLAVAFAEKFSVIGFDINAQRIQDLKNNIDKTGEIETAQLAATKINFTTDPHELKKATFHIITVPTPIDEAKEPDLSALISASELVGSQLKKGDIVVYESTVYPGATEEDCLPVLEKASQLKGGKDFFIGYSPERINPGDKEHTFKKITKVVAGQTPEVLEKIAEVYGAVVEAGIHKASSIKVAEAAKVIENTQRDLNIALINELAMIFDAMNINTYEVLAAASTKWNFLSFKPGLVGGHCIGVDPYYLTHKAKKLNIHPEVILAGRKINDNVGKYIAETTVKKMLQVKLNFTQAKIAILGFTFKENCSDARNTKVIDIYNELKSYHLTAEICDPLVCIKSVKHEYGIDIQSDWKSLQDAEVLILAVAHNDFSFLQKEIKKYFPNIKVIIDVKTFLLNAKNEQDIIYWSL